MEKWLYAKSRFNSFRMKIVTLIPIFNPQASFFNEIVPLLGQQSIIDLELLLINSRKEKINAVNIKSIKFCQVNSIMPIRAI